MQVIIGVDPHKASHTAVAVDEREDELAQMSVRATRTRSQRLLAWAAAVPDADVGDRGSRRDGLPAVPAARRCRRTRRERAGDARGADPGVGHRAGRTRPTRTTRCRSR